MRLFFYILGLYSMLSSLTAQGAAKQLGEQGDRDFLLSRYELAQPFYEKASQAYRAEQNEPGQVLALAMQALCLVEQQKNEAAYPLIREAEQLFRGKEAESTMRLQWAIMRYHENYREPALAKKAQEKLLALLNGQSEELNSKLALRLYRKMAEEKHKEKDHEQAYSIYQALVFWQEQLPDASSSAVLWKDKIILGDIKYEQAQFDAAIVHYEELLEEAGPLLKKSKSDLLGTLYLKVGRHYVKKLNYELAEDYLRQALIYTEKPIERAEIEDNIAKIRIDRDAPQEALKLLGEAMENSLLKDGKTAPIEFQVCLSFAQVATKLLLDQAVFQYYKNTFGENPKQLISNWGEEALKHPLLPELDSNINAVLVSLLYAEKRVKQLDAQEQKPALVDVLLSKGDLFFEAKAFPRAKTSYEEALALMEQIYPAKHPLVAQANRRLAEIYGEEQLFGEALRYIDVSIQAITEQKLSPDKALDMSQIQFPLELLYALGTQGKLLNEMYAINPEAKTLQRAHKSFLFFEALLVQIRRSHINEGSKYKLGQLNKEFCAQAVSCCYMLYQREEKQSFLEEAFRFAELAKAAKLLEHIQNLRARQVLGIPKELSATDDSLKMELRLLQEEILLTMRQGAQNTKSEQLRKLEDSLAEKQKAYAEYLEELKEKHPKYFELKYDYSILSVADIQAELGWQESLVEYVLLNDSTFFSFVLNRETCAFLKKKYKENISLLCYQLPRTLEMKNRDAFMEIGFALYEALLEELLPSCKKQLLIIPDSYLALVPFEVLLSEKPNREDSALLYRDLAYILKTHSVYYNYSASVWAKNKERKKKKRHFEGNFAGFAPSFNLGEPESLQAQFLRSYFNVEKLSALPSAQKEVEVISKRLKSPGFFAEEASEGLVYDVWNKYRVLHFATHGLMSNKSPLHSGLVFTGDEEFDGVLSLHEIYARELQADLVSLSACYTGRGKMDAGEGLISVAHAFQTAGAHNVLMSLWAVTDLPTALLMDKFYAYLAKGYSKVDALRQAKLDILNNANPQLATPAFWAGIILSGDADSIPELQSAWPWYIWAALAVLLLAVLALGYRARKQAA